MSTATKIPTGPTSFTTDVTLKNLLELKTWSATNSNFTGLSSMWVESVTVSLVGQADASKEPAKTMNTWYTTNQTAIAGQSLTDKLKVSSWAIIVDVKTKASTAGATKESIYTNAIPKVTATGNCADPNNNTAHSANNSYPTAGTAGSTWSVRISTNNAFVPGAIRSGSFVKTQRTSTAGSVQVNELNETSWVVTPSKTADFSKVQTDQAFTFGTETKCDETKWASATACKGFGGVWGSNSSNTWAVGTTGGSHRYYHWLADAATTTTDILSIEDKAVVNVLVIENHAD